MPQYVMSVLVMNEAGVLVRVSSLLSRRGFNIRSLAVGETEDESVSRMTILVDCSEDALPQILAQTRKLECVLFASVLDGRNAVTRELMMVKVDAPAGKRGEIIEIANIFRARVIDVSRASLTLELTGESDKTEALLDMLREFGIIETARGGVIALGRGSGHIREAGGDG